MFQGLSQTLRWEDRQVFSRVGWAMTLLVVLQLAVQVLGLRLAAALAPGLLEAAWFDWVLSAAGSYLVAFPAAYLTLRALPAVRAEKETPWTPGGLLQGWFMALALIYSANLATMGLVRLIDGLRDTPMANPVETMLDQPVWFNLLLGCVLAPLAEELLFRKALLDRLKPYGEGFAILASALLFALVHGNLFQMLYAFAVGGFFGYVALRTGGVRWTIPLHAGTSSRRACRPCWSTSETGARAPCPILSSFHWCSAGISCPPAIGTGTGTKGWPRAPPAWRPGRSGGCSW